MGGRFAPQNGRCETHLRPPAGANCITQKDFAERLDITLENLSLLICGKQSLSMDVAMKLSEMIGTSVNYWLNLQNAYDALITEFKSQEE